MGVPTKLNKNALDSIGLYDLYIPTFSIADVSNSSTFVFTTDCINYGMIGIDIDDNNYSYSVQFVESEINDVFNIIRTIFKDNITINYSSINGVICRIYESVKNQFHGILIDIHTYISPFVYNEGNDNMTRYKGIQVIVDDEGNKKSIFYIWRDDLEFN